MRIVIYRLTLVIIISVLVASCGGGGGETAAANTDCVLGTSTVGNCAL